MNQSGFYWQFTATYPFVLKSVLMWGFYCQLMRDKINEKGYNRESIRHLLIFIDHILRLPKQADKRLFQELKPIVEKGEAEMGLSLEDTSFAKFFREEGRKEGEEIGEKRKAKEIAIKLLRKGFSIEEVAEDTGLTIEEISELRGNLDQ